MTDHLNFNVLNWAPMQEARKKAEAEKIQIMEELWQARFEWDSAECPLFLYIICASLLTSEPNLCWTNLFTGGCEAAPGAPRPLQQGASGDQSFQILKRSCDKACGQQLSGKMREVLF